MQSTELRVCLSVFLLKSAPTELHAIKEASGTFAFLVAAFRLAGAQKILSVTVNRDIFVAQPRCRDPGSESALLWRASVGIALLEQDPQASGVIAAAISKTLGESPGAGAVSCFVCSKVLGYRILEVDLFEICCNARGFWASVATRRAQGVSSCSCIQKCVIVRFKNSCYILIRQLVDGNITPPLSF